MVKRFVFGLVLVTVACQACGAKHTQTALTAEQSVRTTVVMVSDLVVPLVCDPAPRQRLGTVPCATLLDVLEPAVDLAINYNRALAAGRLPNIGQTVAAIARLIEVVKTLVPDGAGKDLALVQLTRAQARATGGQ
jgi:hypothetical protein